jgi:hypothetical protein
MKRDHLGKPYFWLMSCLLLLAASLVHAASDIRSERVQFKKGASSAVIESRIKGYETVDYVLGARAGQTMNVSLASKHDATYFNILAPDENEVAMFIGSQNGNQYEGTLPATGDYKIRVYMMRSAARRSEVANYRLETIITGSGKPTVHAPSHDALVPGTGFHATGNIPCSMSKGQLTGSCAFGVQREGQGSGRVTVTKTDGSKRVIFFYKGHATGYDQSQADPGEFRATQESGLTIIHIGDERYEIPGAVIFGG